MEALKLVIFDIANWILTALSILIIILKYKFNESTFLQKNCGFWKRIGMPITKKE